MSNFQTVVRKQYSMALQGGLGRGRRESYLDLFVLNGIYYVFNVWGHEIKSYFPFQQGLKVIFYCSTFINVVQPLLCIIYITY